MLAGYPTGNKWSKDNEITVIVPDEALEGAKLAQNAIHINFIAATEAYEERANEIFRYDQTDLRDYLSEQGNGSMSLYYVSRVDVFESSRSTSTIISYLAIYIGVVFLIISAAVLAIAQLSEASDNAARYGLLRKIGTESRMINRALFTQILIYFGVPLLLAIVHSAVGIAVVSDVVKYMGNLNIVRDAVATGLIIVAIYGGYFFATYWGGKNIVKA
jgi:putative ABC transport system permease protein